MFRPFLDSLMLGSMFFPFIAIAGSSAQGGVVHFYGQIVEPACDVSTQSTPVEMNCPQNGSVPGRTYSGFARSTVKKRPASPSPPANRFTTASAAARAAA